MTNDVIIEEPCDDELPCTWMSDEFFDENGDLESWDLFCTKCGRYRDWSKEEFNDPASYALW